MRIRRPSNATVIALTALVFAMTGSAVAAVDFARNAGAVDGKSAVSAGATDRGAAGKLVATVRRGPLAGRIPAKFLDTAVPQGSSFGRASQVIDNANEAPFPVVTIPGLGTLTATCGDSDRTVGREDPVTTITLINTSGGAINYARATGTGSVAVQPMVANQTASFQIKGSNTYTIQVHLIGTDVLVHGVVRQDGAGTPSASCVNYGQAVRLG
jgi:hypothetical protein